jgi:hypothetical protein
VKQLGFAWFQAVQKPVAVSFHVPAFALPDSSSGSRVIFPSGVKVILNFAPEGDTAVNDCPVKKVVFISFGAMGSAAKAALAPKNITALVRPERSTQKSPFRAVQYGSRPISLAIYRKLFECALRRYNLPMLGPHLVWRENQWMSALKPFWLTL